MAEVAIHIESTPTSERKPLVEHKARGQISPLEPAAELLKSASTKDTFTDEGDSFPAFCNCASATAKPPSESYNAELLAHLCKQQTKLQLSQPLARHGVSEELRARMNDWMLEVVHKADCSTDTYFTASQLIDRFLQHSATRYESRDLHSIGVAAMAVASKLIDVVPMDLKFMDEHVVHHKIPATSLRSLERALLHSLQFLLCAPNEYDFLLALLDLDSSALATCLPKPVDASVLEHIRETAKFVATTNVFKLDFCAYAPSLKAAATLFIVLSKEFSGLDLDALLSTLARCCEIEVSAVKRVAIEIEMHVRQFKALHPRLERIFKYRTVVLT